MVDQPEVANWDTIVYQWEITDPVQGGIGGVANAPLLNLANRTLWLKQLLDSLVSGSLIPPTVAPLQGAAFTGTVTAPNVAPGDNSTKIANTNFVQTAKSGLAQVSVSGGTNVTLTQDQWGVGIIEFIGTLTGNIKVFFPSQTGAWIIFNNTSGAFSLTCQTVAGVGVVIPQAAPDAGIWCDGSTIRYQNSTLRPVFTNAAHFTVGPSTWVVPDGVYFVRATVTGGGGGGSECTSLFPPTTTNTCSGGGGGAGGTMIGIFPVVPGSSIAITVGAGGLPQNPGGTSIFGTFGSATGGQGASFTQPGNSPGGGPGVGAGGQTIMYGGWGSDGQSGGWAFAGNGGGSYWGGGLRAYNALGNPTPPVTGAPGVGGGGAYASTTGSGSQGQNGTVYLEW